MSSKLPDFQQLSSLLDQLEEGEQELPKERRAQPRTPAYDKIPVVVEVAGQPTIHGTLRDISKGGLGLTLPVMLERGTAFTFRASIATRAVRATCHVAHCRKTGDGRYIVGAQIVPSQKPTAAPAPRIAATEPAHPFCTAPDSRDVDQNHLADLRQRLACVLGSC